MNFGTIVWNIGWVWRTNELMWLNQPALFHLSPLLESTVGNFYLTNFYHTTIPFCTHPWIQLICSEGSIASLIMDWSCTGRKKISIRHISCYNFYYLKLMNFYIALCCIRHELFIGLLVLLDINSLGYYRPLDFYKIQWYKSFLVSINVETS